MKLLVYLLGYLSLPLIIHLGNKSVILTPTRELTDGMTQTAPVEQCTPIGTAHIRDRARGAA